MTHRRHLIHSTGLLPSENRQEEGNDQQENRNEKGGLHALNVCISKRTVNPSAYSQEDLESEVSRYRDGGKEEGHSEAAYHS